MHDIEPHHLWRDRYVASEDKRSPHFGRVYNEFTFSNRVYNYYIHPQWDEFGSSTLYGKIIYADYEDGIAIIELIGEWNDCLSNDILFFRQNLVDWLGREGITKYILVMDHVLNFHGSDDCYYEEWLEDIYEEGGYVCMINVLDHVIDELEKTGIHNYITLDKDLQIPNWRSYSPKGLVILVEKVMERQVRLLH